MCFGKLRVKLVQLRKNRRVIRATNFNSSVCTRRPQHERTRPTRYEGAAERLLYTEFREPRTGEVRRIHLRNCLKSLGGARGVALRAAEKFLFGQFRAPHTGQIHRWSVAHTLFRQFRRGVLGSRAAMRLGARGSSRKQFPARNRPLRVNNGPIVLLGGLHYALLGGSLCTEGSYKRTVLTAQYEDVGVGLVQVIVEFREHRFSFLLHRSTSTQLSPHP